jgi:ABC-type Mn2+/Zn2+ transport system permease subunit
MKEMNKLYWITGLLGLALGVSPWVFSYTDNTNALWASIIIGAVILLLSAWKVVARDDDQYWEYWFVGLAGLVAVAAPFVLSFNTLTAALWVSIAIGVLVALVSAFEVFFVEPNAA